MKIIYLASTYKDIIWVTRYYTNVFPEGRLKFREEFYVIEKLLMANPEMGKISDFGQSIREMIIPKSPFSFIYRVLPDKIEVLRVWDQRQNRERIKPEDFQ